jgi:hypothetical protein
MGVLNEKRCKKAIGITIYISDRGLYIVHYSKWDNENITDMGEYLIATVEDYKAALKVYKDAARAARAESKEKALENIGGKLHRRTNKKRKQRRRKTSGRR